MKKTTIFALLFLLFSMITVITLSQIDAEKKQIEEKQKFDMINEIKQITTEISIIEENQEQLNIKIESINAKQLSEEQVKQIATIISENDKNEILQNIKHYDTDAFCLIVPKKNGWFDLQCNKI